MNRKYIESIATYIAVMSLLVLVMGTIFAIADNVFEWDIFPDRVEKFLVLLFASIGVVVCSSVLVSVMINISLIAQRLLRIVELKESQISTTQPE